MFLRCNVILHVPEITRTDEYSIGHMDLKGKGQLERCLNKKLLNLERDRELIIAETLDRNQHSAFGTSYVEAVNVHQSLVGTFFDRK